MSEPHVIIILLNYRNWRDTAECVESLKKIEYTNYTIVIVENGSPDESEKILNSRFPEIAIIQTGENLGYTGGVNVGMRFAMKQQPEYILLLNNDTIVEPAFLKPLVDAMEEDPGIGCATGKIYFYPGTSKLWYAGGKMVVWRGLANHYVSEKDLPLINESNRYPVTFISGCMMLLRISMIDSIGLQDERFFMCLDDIEYSMRIMNKGFRLMYVPSSVIYHKARGDSKSLFTLYYSIRNRLLFINTALPFYSRYIAGLYFLLVMVFKLCYWGFTNQKFFFTSLAALKDYFKGNLGKGRGVSEFSTSVI